MVGFVKVGEFVGEDVIDKRGPQLHGGPVDTDPPGSGGRTSLVAKTRDLEAAGVGTEPVGPVRDVRAQPGDAAAGVPVDDRPRPVRKSVARQDESSLVQPNSIIAGVGDAEAVTAVEVEVAFTVDEFLGEGLVL